MVVIGITLVLLWTLIFMAYTGLIEKIFNRCKKPKEEAEAPKEETEAHTCETCYFHAYELDSVPCYRCKRADEFRGDLWTEKED